MTNQNVKLYALSTCIHCRDAKAFLDKCGIDYDCVHVDKLDGDEKTAAYRGNQEDQSGVRLPDVDDRRQSHHWI